MKRSLLLLLSAAAVQAQSTQCLITGSVYDGSSGGRIEGVVVQYRNEEFGLAGVTRTNRAGVYAIPGLSPGTYRVRVERDGYQAQEIQRLVLPVAARLELDFRLRPLADVWEAGQYGSVFFPASGGVLGFFGPDVDTSRTGSFEANRGARRSDRFSPSYVIDPRQIGDLPLTQRQVYAMIATLPGVVAADAGGRGLGFSANGQRTASSNFLLDGLEHSDTLITGPFAPAAPESVQEYRISTGNFSAEYGQTGGFLANAVTRAGTTDHHGLVYGYLQNAILDANAFVRNANGIPRPPRKQSQSGFSAGGPLRRERTYYSGAFERYGYRNRGDQETFLVPVAERFQQCAGLDPAGPGAWQPALDLLRRFPPPSSQPLLPNAAPCANVNLTGAHQTRRRITVNQTLASARGDYRSASGSNRVMGRLSLFRLEQPDYLFSLYRDFQGSLDRQSEAVALSWVGTISPAAVNELLFGWRRTGLGFDRGHAADFGLSVFDLIGTRLIEVALPGNGSSGVLFDFDRQEYAWEISDNLTVAMGRHLIAAGAGTLLRRNDSFVGYLAEPIYAFGGSLAFGRSQLARAQLAIGREALAAAQLSRPGFSRRMTNAQFRGFLQDNFRITPRLAVNLGVRYESHGAPRNTADPDATFEFPSGASLPERIAAARLRYGGESASAYRVDRNNWAARAGFSFDLTGSGKILLRGAAGTFYDRPYDNLTIDARLNTVTAPVFCLNASCAAAAFDIREPTSSLLNRLSPGLRLSDTTPSAWIDRNLRTPYVNAWFVGLQQQFAPEWSFEINYSGSGARKLIATDIVNRLAQRRLNPNFNDIYYRSNSGSSAYHALTSTVTARRGPGQFRVSYTWSHAIDNQSDPVAGMPFRLDLCDTNPAAGCGSSLPARFSREFDSRADRGSADFDQRHNLVFYSLWSPRFRVRQPWLAALASGWQVGQLAAVRSGFPYTVITGTTVSPVEGRIILNRPNLRPGAAAELTDPVPIPGGMRLLNPAAFELSGGLGGLGRNSLPGPGRIHVDLSLAKSFPLGWLGESGRLQVRADLFNFLNHANLSQPNIVIGNPAVPAAGFGEALFGPPVGIPAGFPSVAPLSELARQVQLMVRVQF